jgi:threonine dehydratase
MQPIGSFKIRGAMNKISSLTEEERKKGVIASSAGNHAQGVAWASRLFGVDAQIVMPKRAPLMKVHNTRKLGAEVFLEGETYDEAYVAALEIAKKTGRIFVHAFEDPKIIAGQGTCALEVLDQLPEVDALIVSMGGGGLMTGMATVMREKKPSVQLIGCQAEGARALVESLQKGKALKRRKLETFADGIAVAQASEKMFTLLQGKLDRVETATEEAIVSAVLSLIEKAKVVTEGAAALPLAVLEKIKGELQGKKVVLVITGGNIDVNVLGRIINQGMVKAGRILKTSVLIADRPGSLLRLTAILAREEANILQVIHDRGESFDSIDRTEIALTVETRGPEHSQKVLDALRKYAFRVDVLRS